MPLYLPALPCMQIPKDVSRLFEALSKLGPDEDLPADLPDIMYRSLGAQLMAAQYAGHIRHYLKYFPPEK